MLTRPQAEIELKRLFGNDRFYDDQWSTIERLLRGERILLIEKTGYGKSLCYQFPATQLDGLTVVFSPLLALMRDQLKKMNGLGIPAKCVNSEQSDEENAAVLDEAQRGKLKLLYIAPERQENDAWIEATRSMKLAMVVIDEAHCISVWGHDFRPAFRRIINLVRLLPAGFPVLGTTATATKTVERDIIRQMGGNTVSIRGGMARENFQLFVIPVRSEERKMAWLAEHVGDLPGTGVIYTGTRVNTQIYARWLEFNNISAVHYSAGLDPASRKEVEQGLLDNRWKCVVATNALGMGIDKPDIRFIIHTQIPASLIHYYQEIGRAGRDGKKTYLILFYCRNDEALPQSFIETARPAAQKYSTVIDALKEKRMGERALMKAVNMTQNQVRTILADLIDQKIVNEMPGGRSKEYEFRYGSPPLDMKPFDALRAAKMAELEKMVDYVHSDRCRMKLLCDYLNEEENPVCGKCDNDLHANREVRLRKEMKEKIDRFQSTYFPVLDVESKTGALIDGVAGAYYGAASVGAAIRRCKYEAGGDFPEFLVELAVQAFNKHLSWKFFDLAVYVPPTESGALVRTFALKVAACVNLPVSHNLVRLKETRPQRELMNGWLKRDNVAGAFSYMNPEEVKGKSILIIDDVFDSGATIKEVGKLLSGLGASQIAPLVIARTVGGDITAAT